MTAPATTTTYLCGVEADQVHAVAGVGSPRAVCGAPYRPASKWGEYRGGVPRSLQQNEHLCPACAWAVALDRGTTVAELEHWASCGASGPSGDLAARTVQAVLDKVNRLDPGEGSEVAVRLLAVVSRHWPVQLLDEGCADRDCDHANTAECVAFSGSVACPSCSVLTGPEAGEWEGQYEVPVSSPCSALTAIARHLGVAEVAA